MNPFFKIMEIQGYPMHQAEVDLSDIQSMDVLSFFKWTQNQRKSQFNFFKEQNPLFKKILTKHNESLNYAESPILSKRDVQVKLKELISLPFLSARLFTNNTSGSSGTPFFFAKNKHAHAMTWALIRDRYRWHRIEYGKSLQARFYGIPLKGTKYYKEKIKDLIAARVRFPVFDLSDETLWGFINQFKKRPFEYLNGYTSSLVYFAQFCVDNNIILKEICRTLKICFPTSEMCSIEDRRVLEKVTGLKKAINWFTAYPYLNPGVFGLCGVRGPQPSEGGKTTFVSGGAFAARRSVLYENFNFLLFDLYDQKLGKGEDAITGYTLSKQGKVVYNSKLLFYHNDQKDSAYSIDHFSFARRVAFSRKYLSLEKARLDGSSMAFAKLHYHWYMIWRVSGLLVNCAISRTKARKSILTGTLRGWKMASGMNYVYNSTPKGI
jgi:hypothetical protein